MENKNIVVAGDGYDLVQIGALAVDIREIPTQDLISNSNEKIKSLVGSIDVTSPLEVSKWGGEVAKEINRFSDNVLSTVTGKDLEESKNKVLNNLDTLLRQVDMNELRTLNEEEKKVKGLMKLIKSVKNRKEDLIVKYSTIGSTIAKIEKELDDDKEKLKESIKTIDKLVDIAEEMFEKLKEYRYAGEIVHRKLIEEIIPQHESQLENCKEFEKREVVKRLTDISEFKRSLEVKLGDFDVSMVVAAQKVPQLRIIQQNYMMLLQKIDTTESTTLPVFKTAIIEAVNVSQQKAEAKILSEIDSVTNSLLKYNADSIVKQSIEIRGQVSKSAITYETLAQVMDTLISGVEEIRRLDLEYNEYREEEQAKIRQLVRGDKAQAITSGETKRLTTENNGKLKITI